MRSTNKHTPEELERFIQLHAQGVSYNELRDEYGLKNSLSAFKRYFIRYQMHGFAGLHAHTGNNTYTQAFKLKVVQEYQAGNISLRGLALKYNIPDDKTVKRWINQYTKGEELKEYAPRSEVYTVSTQRKTQDEKLMIVKEYLDSDLSYKEMASKHQITYKQIYSWVQKYQQYGPDGLIDNRGRRKAEHTQTTEEKLRTKVAALEARVEYLETERAASKKLKQIESEMMSQESNMKQNFKQ